MKKFLTAEMFSQLIDEDLVSVAIKILNMTATGMITIYHIIIIIMMLLLVIYFIYYAFAVAVFVFIVVFIRTSYKNFQFC